jgi:hypothetical protein
MRCIILMILFFAASCAQEPIAPSEGDDAPDQATGFKDKQALQLALTAIKRNCGGLEGYDLIAVSKSEAVITVVGPVLLPPISKRAEGCAVEGVRRLAGVSRVVRNLPEGNANK